MLVFAAEDSDAGFGMVRACCGADTVNGELTYDACGCCAAEERDNPGNEAGLFGAVFEGCS